jgi:hypothetical protein
LFQSNGLDPDLEKMNELNLTDRQRTLVLKLSEKRRKLDTLQASNQASSGGIRSGKLNHIATQLQRAKEEVEELEEDLAVSLGQSRSDLSRKRFKELDEHFNPDLEDEGYTDEVAESIKRFKLSDYPDIPTLGSSENLATVRDKLDQLYIIRSRTSSLIKEPGGGSTSKAEDDEVDPLDAFMAETSQELEREETRKAEAKLVAINAAITEFERLEKILSINQFKDGNIAHALEQKKTLSQTMPVKGLDTEPSASRGKGTVWEEEFRKDESVPQRTYVETSKSLPARSHKVRLNVNVGGLHLGGNLIRSATTNQPSAESSEKRQEELRKKLGY